MSLYMIDNNKIRAFDELNKLQAPKLVRINIGTYLPKQISTRLRCWAISVWSRVSGGRSKISRSVNFGLGLVDNFFRMKSEAVKQRLRARYGSLKGVSF
jgi:hypothetical protein